MAGQFNNGRGPNLVVYVALFPMASELGWRHPIQSPPFHIQPLTTDGSSNARRPSFESPYSQSMLPASYRTESDDLAPADQNIMTCIEKALDLGKTG